MVFLQGAVNPITLEKNFIISEQLIKCICKINKKGSGFFCLIPYGNKSLPVLISAAHIIGVKEDLKEISLEINECVKIIELNEERKTFTDLYLDITIIEIIPEKDHIYDFLMLDDNLFKDYSIEMLKNESIYILHFDFNSKIISYGNIKQMSENNIYHSCNTQNLSGGAPIISVTSGKIIGLQIGAKKNYNFGTFLKIPITQFINSNKGYINQKGLTSNNYSINKNICSINNNNFNNNISSNINQNDLEKIKVLEEKLKEVNDILHDRINKANSIININQKTIEELKEKLSRFPFELLKGVKLMSIIVISSDKKLHRTIICKNTELFCDLERKIYQNNDKIDIGNYFTLNGKKIDETKSLDDNNIKDNDIIVLNNLKV